ncbi:MAG TPA: lipocalin family protein, partial [Flavobacterium sp.]|nr:lipocalin family protein [Flavobacterium sp.]
APTIEETNHLLGKWNLNTISLKITIDGEVYQEMEDLPVEGLTTMQFDFRADNTVEYYFNNNDEIEEGIGTYQRNGNNLTITIEGEPADFEILLSDANNLHLGIEDEYEYQGLQLKEEITFKFLKM